MNKDYKRIIPTRFQNSSYEDIPEEIRNKVIEQIKKRDGVYFYGDSGVGKTHLVCGLIKNILSKDIAVMFFNTGHFLEMLRDEFGDTEKEETLFKQVMDFKGILVFDDIGAEKTSEWAQERLYLIINKKYEDMLPMIFTSNFDMEILSARMGDRISSRIAGMTEIIKIDGEDNRLNKND